MRTLLLFACTGLLLPAHALAQRYAVQFAANNGGLVIGSHPIMQTGPAVTIECWGLDPGTSSAQFVVYSRFQAGVDNKTLAWNPDGSITYMYYRSPTQGPGGALTTGPALFPRDNRWHHLAFVRRANDTYSIYVDGIGVVHGGPGPCDQFTGCGLANCNCTTFIGRHTLSGSQDPGVMLAEFRVSTIDRYSGASFVPTSRWVPDASTALLLPFSEGQGTTTADIGQAGQVGSLESGVQWVPIGSVPSLWDVSTYGAGTGPQGLTLADLDATSGGDVVTANYGSQDLTIRFNDGAGGFGGTPKTITLGPGAQGPLAVAAGDLDGDGAADDLAAACNDTHNVAMIASVNDASPAVTLVGSGGLRPVHVAAGDLDGTATRDLVVAREGEFFGMGGGIGVIRDGGAAVNLAGGSATQVVKVRVGDLDGDGDQDIAAVARGSTDEVQLYLNDGAGSFAFAGAIALASQGLANGLCCADLDGDGDTDLAVTETTLIPTQTNTLRVLCFAAAGAFGPEDYTSVSTPTPGTLAFNLACGDFEDDSIDCFTSRTDLAVVNVGTGTVATHHGFTGTGFTGSDLPPAGSNPVAVAMADLDGDGSADIAVINQGGNDVSVGLTRPPQLSQIYGTGCAGTSGVPAIAGSGLPVLGAPYTVSVSNARAFAPALLLFSPACANDALNASCTLLVDPPLIAILRFVDGTNQASLGLTIPNDPSAAGFDAFFQWGVFDPLGAFAGILALSDGLRLQLGM